jgi:predicted O-methyltransferase YrrM
VSTRSIDIKNYVSALFAAEDEVLSSINANAKNEGLPQIEIPQTVGKLLYCLAKIQRPKRILEIGTLAGYSTVWLARALPEDGRLISLELEPHHASVARKNFELAGLSEKIEVREGVARELMENMIAEGEAPFDLIFIDADKEGYPRYLECALSLSHPGTLILSDNLIPKGESIGTFHPNNFIAKSIYQFNNEIATDPRLESILATTIVGEKGRIDALGISIVK